MQLTRDTAPGGGAVGLSHPEHPPAVDPELVPAYEAAVRAFPRLTAETLAELRRLAGEEPPVDLTAVGRVRVEEIAVLGPAGAPAVTLLVLSPTAEGPRRPMIYHIHGGGMVMGDRRSSVEMFLPYVADGRAVVVSVEYRLAPEHQDPAPVEDCYAGLCWAARNAGALGVDPGRIILAGSSAGGGLAAGTALLARDRGFPAVAHQMLMAPMLDDRCTTPSSQMLDRTGVWDREENLFAWTALLGDRRGGPDVTPYAAPARIVDASALPPTYVDVGTVDSFRDEAIDYAYRLQEAGVEVDLHVSEGGFHGSEGCAPDAATSRATLLARDAFLSSALARRPTRGGSLGPEVTT